MDLYVIKDLKFSEANGKVIAIVLDDYACDIFVEAYCKYNNISPEEFDDRIVVEFIGL